ncbi:branched-chain amino acid ABC transporter permease [Oceanicola sp. D3]|uniref:AzlC family ABC transporter permease n=1 Tax=Oceanicola sp. D3 TaxID=2587163 RepID=UPI00111CF0CB|nr:AzlC family ABC transporter permease [Oceanicola sp. D3]QDC08114.1 branched-chain amino acid ABC transporter permease [Oceanicola sp. D3]
MPSTTPKKAYASGIRAGLPFLIVVVPFGAIFGVIGMEAGLNIAEVMAFTVLVIAGGAQITALQLMQDNAPTIIVLATALAVNARMAMYSASMAPHIGTAPLWQRALISYLLVDQSYAASVLKYEEKPQWDVRTKVAYFLGTITPVAPMWYLGTLAGALAGTAIPESWSLDVAVPLAFLAIVAPGLRTPAHIAAAFVALVASLLLAWMPFSTGVIAAGMLGMIAGAEVERAMGRRAA